MLSKKGLLSAMVGMAMMALPVGVAAGYHDADGDAHHLHDQTSHQRAQRYNYQYRSDRDRGDAARRTHRNWDDDYNWGGHNRYAHSPSYFSASPPDGYGHSQGRNYLLQRRQAAYQMMRLARSRGDSGAANRLQTAINQINSRLGNDRY